MEEQDEKPKVKFDQKSLAALRPDGVTWTYADPATPGLWFRMMKSGVKSYFFVYRMGGRGAKLNWLKVGDFEALPLVRAQKLARAYRTKVDEGVDPAKALLEAANRGSTVEDVVKRFQLEYAPKNLKPKTRSDYSDSIRVHILPSLGKVPIRDLDRDQVTSWHASLVGKGGRGEVAANRALAILSSICTQAEIWKLRTEGANPCRHVNRFEEAPRVRDIRPSELEAIGKAIVKLHGRHSLWALAAVQVAGLCSGRVSEVLALRRDRDVFLDEGYAIIREHKTAKKAGAKHLELPPAAVKILRGLPEMAGNPWYFPGRYEGEPISRHGLRKTWLAICETAGVTDLHLHDFRSFAASEGLDQGIDSKVTSVILGHGDRRTTEKHYTKVRNKKASEAAAQISAPVAQAFGLEPAPKPNVKRLLRRAFARVKGR